MTAPPKLEQSVQASERPVRRADQVRLRTQRAASAALGELLTQPAVAGLSGSLIGALVCVAQRLLASAGPLTNLGVEEARAVVQMRGSSFAEACGALDALTTLGLVRSVNGCLRIDAVNAVLVEHDRLLKNRSKGWQKRQLNAKLADAPSDVGISHEATPIVQALAVSSPAASTVPLLPTESVTPDVELAASKDVKPGSAELPGFELAAPSSKRPDVKRFGPTDRVPPSLDDPTVVRMPCEGGRTAELTQSYLEDLKRVFKGVDVEQQLQLAASWCVSNVTRQKQFTGVRRFIHFWLSKASTTASVQEAVVRAGNTRNGFGQGGGYGSQATEVPLGDDLSDLADLRAQSSRKEQYLEAKEQGQVQRTPSSLSHSYRTLPRGQRRLSDQRGA